MSPQICAGMPPIAGPSPRVLILGSMPGEQSLAKQEYYAHPRNAFWPIMQTLFGIPVIDPYEARTRKLASRGVALWDVIHTCSRKGSLDSGIVGSTVVVNDFVSFFAANPSLRAIAFNGAAAKRVFDRYVFPAKLSFPEPGIKLIALPSTSPANAALTTAQKAARYGDILEHL